ncbi:MAG: hypothetical protein AAFQ78_04020, partial [Bacteroidota bacterium]
MKKICLLSLALLLSNASLAKEHSKFREFLNHVHISFATGYGKTYYTNQVVTSKGCTMYREGDHLYIVYKSANPNAGRGTYQVRWFDGPHVRMRTDTDLKLLPAVHQVVGTAKFTGSGHTIPFTLSGYVDAWGKLRLGVGGALFINTLRSLQFEKENKHSPHDLGEYIPVHKTHYRIRPFGVVGYKFVENVFLSMLLDLNIGFDFVYAKLSDPQCVNRFLLGIYNIGITLEKHISEYFRIQGRISYEKGGTVDSLDKEKTGIVLERSNISFQLGLSFNYTELPRCPVPNCNIELKHRHGGT